MTYSTDSSDYSSESEVEYEPIVVEDAEGKKTLMKEETNPLAPVVIVSTKATEKSALKTKKTKVFATKDSMLSLIESVNCVQDEKIQAKLEKDASYLQRLNNIEKATQERKSMKNERLNKIKDNLRKGGVRVKGENKRKVREINEKKEAVEGGRGKKSYGGQKSQGGQKSHGGPKNKGTSKPRGAPTSKPQKKVKFAV